MKKLIYLIVVIGALALIVAGCGLLTVPPSEESELDDKGKPTECTTIQDGVLTYSLGHYLEGEPLIAGYDIFGYNYQAHMFNGSTANVYLGRAGFPPYEGDDEAYLNENPDAEDHWAWEYRNNNLVMKWNDAWLSNKDCDEDGVLDRPDDNGGAYIGSGAWCTNHEWGTYKGDCWSFIGDWVLELDFEGVPYAHDVTFTTEVPCESFSGTGGYPSGEIYTITSTVSGIVDTSVVPNKVLITITYTSGNIGSQRYLAGTIADDGTMSGDWTSNVGPTHSGTWKSTMGTALCEWDYFCKIVAAPVDAYAEGDFWYTADGIEIGPSIWGQFAIIQEVSNDPCAGEEGILYKSPAGPGLGNW